MILRTWKILTWIYELGLGEPFGLPHLGRQTNRRFFSDPLTADIKKETRKKKEKRLRLAVIVKRMLVKSSLVNSLSVIPSSLTNIRVLPRPMHTSPIRWRNNPCDTAGLRKRSKITESIEFYSTLAHVARIDEAIGSNFFLMQHKEWINKILQIVDATMERQPFCYSSLSINGDLVEKETNTARAYRAGNRTQSWLYDLSLWYLFQHWPKQRILSDRR